jgi:hypothetical protein
VEVEAMAAELVVAVVVVDVERVVMGAVAVVVAATAVDVVVAEGQGSTK